tara:strand:- start:2330 stop:2575 length:246 start_codon:yes stop_codon:yes gene_type:complete
MHTIKEYSEIFKAALDIDDKKFKENLKYNEIEEWDSIGHMRLVADLEEKFKISFETDDIVDFSSFKKGIEILKKYKINISK